MNIVVIFLLFVVFAILGILALRYGFRYPILTILLVLGIFILDVLFWGGLPVVPLGNFQVSLLDILSALLIILGVSRLLFGTGEKRKAFPLLIWGVLLVISLLRGIDLFGVEKAVNFFRPYLYFFAPLFAIVTIQSYERLFPRFVYLWGWVAWILIGVAVWRWGLVATGLLQNANWIAPGGMMSRVLNAAQAYFLLQSVVFAFVFQKHKKILPKQNLVPYIILPTIIFLQHRTVWVILAFILFALFLLQRQLRPMFSVLAIGSALVSSIILMFISDTPLLAFLTGSMQNMHNFEWRTAGWLALLSPERFQNLIDYFIGQPFGTGYERYLFGASYVTEYSPHNFYIQTFLNIGGIGLFVMLYVYGKTVLSLSLQIQDKQKLAMGLLLISQLLFFITYSPNYEQGIILSFAILLSDSKNR